MRGWLNRLTAALDEWHGRWGQEKFFFSLLGLCILLGLCCWFVPGLPLGDDLNFHLYRMEQLAQAFRRGQVSLPIYHEAFDGYGYGVSLFYGDAWLYPPALLRAAGVPLIVCVKAYVLVLFLLMGWLSYRCAWRLSRSCFAGFCAGLLICWSSYLATDLFNRFALGELFAFVSLPLALLGYIEVFHGKQERWWLLSLGFAGLLLAHNLSFMMAVLLFALLFLLQCRQWLKHPRCLWHLVLAAIVCALLTAFFWGPMVEQLCSQRMTLMEVTRGDISWRAMPWWRLLLALPDTGATGGGHVWTPPGPGVLLLALAVWRLWECLRHQWALHVSDTLLFMGVFSCFLASEWAPWQGVLGRTPLGSMQFPWRFLLFATCFLAIGNGCMLGRQLKGDWPRQRRWLLLMLVWCGGVWLLNVGTAYWQGFYQRGMVYEAPRLRALEVGVMHYFPAGLTAQEVFARGERVGTKGEVVCISHGRPKRGGFSCVLGGRSGTLELPLVFYRGYEANHQPGGTPLSVFNSGTGLVSVAIPKDCQGGTVTVRYRRTLVQWLSGLLSLITALALAERMLLHRHNGE